MRYLLIFLFPVLCFSQSVIVGGSQASTITSGGRLRASGLKINSGPTPGAARTAIPDFTGLTIVDVAAVEGWDAADMSQELTAAINDYKAAGTPTVLMLDDDNGSTWEIDSPINISAVNDLYIYIESGVTFRQGIGAWGAGSPDDLFRFDSSDNLRIYAYGATLDMDKSAFTSSEFAMVFIANDSDNLELWGGTYQDSGGDGVYVSNWTGAKIMDVVTDNNSRQGISIIDAVNLEINGCVMKNTAPNGLGSAQFGPWDGVDFEPNNSTQDFENILIKNSDMLNNDAAFMDIAWGNFDGGAVSVSMTIEDCYGNNNHDTASPWTTGTGEVRVTCASDITGTVDFNRIFIDGADFPGIYSTMEADGPLFTYEDAVLYDTNSTSGFASIRLRRIGTPCADETTLGGIFFDNTTVYNNVDDYIIDVPNITGNTFKNVTGNIKAITDYTSKDITYEAGYSTASNVNVTLAFDMDSAPPTTTLNIAATEDIAAEDTQNDLVFTVTRTSSEVDYALPFRVAYSGTATIRDDYHGLPSGFVIPAGSSSTTITVVPRNDVWTNSATEGDETVIITLQAMTDAYTVGTNSSATGTIKESL